MRRPSVESYYEFDHTHTFLLLSIPITNDLLDLGAANGAHGLNFGSLHDRRISDQFLSSVIRQLWFALQTESVDPLHYLPAAARYLVVELAALMHRTNQKSTGGLSGPTKKTVLEYVHFNLDQSISINDLATLSQLSDFHFLRAFRQTFGVTPHRYLILQRVEKAKELLTNSAHPIGDIARLVGYGSAESLNRAFKTEGLPPPQQFRRLR